MHFAIDGETLLALWERGLAQPVALRADALLGDVVAQPPTLGERNTRLAALHAQLFGRELDLLSHCPACGSAAQFSGDCALLAGTMPPDIARTHRLQTGAHLIEFRLPVADDIDAASGHGDEERFARVLLERCVIACSCDGRALSAQALPLSALDALSQRMEALDPAASVSFALDCPQCHAHWDAPLDLAQLVWQKLQAAAERLLLEVDTLARSYGWTEPDVMALSPTRRAAYVQMAAASS